MRIPPFAFVLALSAPPAVGLQSFELEIDPRASSATLAADFSVELPSSVIGNWDATTNPSGTRTVPGIGGGPGNLPVPMDLTFAGLTDFAGAPLGGLALEVDEPALAVEVRALGIDLLGGASATSAMTLTLLYSTFRTFQPDALYIGGFPLELPLGEQTISDARLDQTGRAAAGTLAPTGAPGEYTLSVLVPVELSFLLDTGTEQIPVGPLPLTLALAGELTLDGDVALLALSFAAKIDQTLPDPLPGFVIEDAPLDLPTILPPGDTAHLLLDATIASLTLASDLSADLVASGTIACGFESYCEAEPNSTGAAVLLETLGTPDALAEDLTFLARGLPAHTTGFFVMSTTAAFEPGYRGHVGNLCVGPRQVRFAQDVLDSGEGGAVRYAPDFDELPNGVVFLPGSTWHFQLWYRDLVPGPTWNSSDAVRVRFCAAE